MNFESQKNAMNFFPMKIEEEEKQTHTTEKQCKAWQQFELDCTTCNC